MLTRNVVRICEIRSLKMGAKTRKEKSYIGMLNGQKGKIIDIQVMKMSILIHEAIFNRQLKISYSNKHAKAYQRQYIYTGYKRKSD